MSRIIIDRQPNIHNVWRKAKDINHISFFRNTQLNKLGQGKRWKSKEKSGNSSYYFENNTMNLKTQGQIQQERSEDQLEPKMKIPKKRQKYAKSCHSDHERIYTARNIKNKKLAMSEINVFQQNQELSFLQDSFTMMENPSVIVQELSLSRTVQTLTNKGMATISTSARQTKPNINFSESLSKNQKTIYIRRNLKNKTQQHQNRKNCSICKEKEEIGLFGQKKILTARPTTLRVLNNSKKIAISKNVMSFKSLRSQGQQSHKSLSLKSKGKNKNTKIQFPKKQSKISPWD